MLFASATDALYPDRSQEQAGLLLCNELFQMQIIFFNSSINIIM